ncbi:hypothetical protein AAC387_Pa05g2844 [Persea americana]
MLGVARLAAEPERRVLVLWQLGALLRGAAQGDRDWVGEERAEVLVGGAQSALRGRNPTGPGRPDAGGVLGADEREGAGGELVGTAAVRAQSRVGWWLRESLRVELGPGGAVRGGADGGLAAVRGAAAEQVGGGGEGAGVGCGEGEGRVGRGGGGGETGESGDGVEGRRGSAGTDGCNEGEGSGSTE